MKEALRYLNNAKEILKSASVENGTYTDVKPVREACGVAYLAVLIAIDEYLLKKGMRNWPMKASAAPSMIERRFNDDRELSEARVEATVTSAFTLEPEQLKTLSEALKRKLGREVNLTAQVDKALMGGIVIRAGDLVIDGSVRGRLADLAAHMSQ